MLRPMSALLVLLAAVAAQANLLKDPGFEAARDKAFREWQVPAGSPGALTVVTEAGAARSDKACAELRAAEGKEGWQGRCLAVQPVRIAPGARCRFSVWARGEGGLVLGCVEYGERDGKPAQNLVGKDRVAPLTAEWKEMTFIYFQEDAAANRIVPCIEVRGEKGWARLDDAVFVEEPAPGYAMTVQAGHTMAPQGGTVRFDFAVTAPADAGAPQVRARRKAPDGSVTEATAAVGPDGKATWAFSAANDAATGPYEMTFVLDKAGVAAQAWVDVVEPAVYEAFAQAAKAVRVPTPAHLVFVGDSLTAQKRGYNYVDKVAGWLRQKYGDQAQVTNAGVGGDYLYRVRDRLEKDVLALKPTPTRVFIFLGHNDSKLSSASEYKKPVVAFEEVEGLFVELVKRIREKTGARVTIMSSTSSVHEITKATADKAREAKRAHNFFGVPEALETFNAGARKAAEATQSDYLDVYGPTKAHPNKPSLFSPDGVHLSIEGNRFIALEVLRRLGGQ